MSYLFELTSGCTYLNFSRFFIKILVTTFEVQSAMWVRNGMHMASQTLALRQYFFSKFFIDSDLYMMQVRQLLAIVKLITVDLTLFFVAPVVRLYFTPSLLPCLATRKVSRHRLHPSVGNFCRRWSSLLRLWRNVSAIRWEARQDVWGFLRHLTISSIH